MFGRRQQRWPHQDAALRIVRSAQSEQKKRRRIFDSGHLRLAILESIDERTRDGFDVIAALETRCGGLYSPSAGIVYPMLSLLEDQGFIAAHELRGERKRYTITRAGQLHLDENQPFLNAIHARFGASPADGSGSGERSGGASGLREAFARLKQALVLPGRAGHHDAARLEKMQEILTRAAREIEAL
ncbi:PadR family transcriptional regulator [Caballeronia ptereochthonis]|uniref:PadR-like family transcriptional regulator n=1 Tax=Caballeronia ptereochthonis TaxID=1777144 RepID=A0A158CZ24_9BURK|nr:PadR family transcriptional regulator [Caballeronia ptereochthonis]SAK87196.1 PadR-like family transcriptional regulator [Caballeronia ptereochthonis]